MRANKSLNNLLDEAERRGRCAFGTTPTQRQTLLRRTRAGELERPYCNVYARRDYWANLNPLQKTLNVINALALMHPTWKFAGPSAAAVLGLNPPWSLCGNIWIAGADTTRKYNDRHLRKIYVPDQASIATFQSIKVTTVARTLVDCALRFEMRQVLPLYDCAARKAILQRDEINEINTTLRQPNKPVELLLNHTDPLSENGGESMCRATLLEAGFAPPTLQREFIDPQTPVNRYRADFSWNLYDGRIIVLEFDGNDKYRDPSMTHGHSTEQVVFQERNRESALKRAGVTTIVRTNYREVYHRSELVSKLAYVGVPRSTQGFANLD